MARLAAHAVPAFAIPLVLALVAAVYLLVGASGDDASLTPAPVNGDDDLLRFS